MILNLFTLLIIISTIFSFIKKKYLNVFIPCILFLPEFYGIDFSDSLPILTVSRMMMIVFFVYAFLNRRRSIKINASIIRSLTLPYCMLFGYFLIRIIANLFYLTKYSYAYKTIFSIITEELLLLIGLFLLSPTSTEIISAIKTTVWCATFLFAIGIFESFTGFRPFDSLFTVSRGLSDSYVRLGLLRSVTTMSLPNYFGNMCLLMTPLIFYLLNSTHQKRYIFCLFLDFLAIVHSGCRSDIIFFAIIAVLYPVLVLLMNKDKISFILRSFMICFIALISWMVITSAVNKNIEYYYTGTAKSVLNVVGFNFDLDEGAPEGVDGYGTNHRGVLSRTIQLTGIEYTLKTSPIYGLGRGFQIRKDIYYLFMGKWGRFSTVDMGIVEIIAAEGLLGFLAYTLLFVSYFIILLRLRCNTSDTIDLATYFILPITYLLCTLSTANMTAYLTLITAYILAGYNKLIKL